MSMASIKLVGILSLHMSTAFVDAEVEEEESRGLGFPVLILEIRAVRCNEVETGCTKLCARTPHKCDSVCSSELLGCSY